MKHFSLKFKLSRCVILKYLVLKFAIFGIIIPLNGFAQGASSELTKEIDFSSAVTRITQKYEYWCVYACLESLNTSLPQCTHCFNFLHRFYMDGNTGHCVVFLGSKLYNNSWDDPESKIYLMNPAFKSIREATLTEINDTCDIIYCK